MLRSLIFVVVGIIVGAACAKIDSRLKIRSALAADDCSNASCAHLNRRILASQNQAKQTAGPFYIAIGDSTTEYASLPEICGRKPINAGVSGATVATFLPVAPTISSLRPDFVLIALGTNDARLGLKNGFPHRYGQLINAIGIRSIIVSVPPSPAVPDVEWFNSQTVPLQSDRTQPLQSVSTIDGIHLSPADYEHWRQSIIDGARRICSG